MNHKIVDLSFVEKRRNDASSTHHPDVFPLVLPQTGCERFDGFAHELHARRRWRLQESAGEDIVFNSCIEGRPVHAFLLKFERCVVCLSAPQDRVDRLIECTHAVVALRTRTVEPVDGAVGSGNKAVGAGGDVDDDFALTDHGGTGNGQILTRSTLGFPSGRLSEEGGPSWTSLAFP